MSTATDTLIVGAGPIGLEMAAALRQAGMDHVLVEAGAIGQTVTWYAPGTRFFSSPERIAIAGVPLVTRGQEKATREEYLAHLRAVVLQHGLTVRTFERAEAIGRAPDGWLEVRTRRIDGERAYRARRVILAIGDLHRPRLLGIPGEDLPHASHYLRDPHEYFGQRVVIVGSRNSAVEAAIRLHRVGARVSLCCRAAAFDRARIKYWLLPEMEWLIKSGRVGFHPGVRPVAVLPEGVRVARPEGGGQFVVEGDAVLLLTGYVQDPSLFERAGVSLVGPERAPLHNPRTMQTNVDGLYVIGTASAGTQSRFRSFIETCHVHVERVLRAIRGQPPPADEEEAAEGMLEA